MLKDWFQFETYNMSTTSQIQLRIEEKKKMANEEKAEGGSKSRRREEGREGEEEKCALSAPRVGLSTI